MPYSSAAAFYAGAFEGEQHFARRSVHGVKLAVAFAKENQISSDENSGLGGLIDPYLPDNFARSGVGRTVQAKIGEAFLGSQLVKA